MDHGIQTRVAMNLRKIRAEKSLSLSGIARGSGLSKATLSKLEAGAGNPTIETLSNLAGYLGVPLEDLLSEKVLETRVVRATEEAWVRGSAVSMRAMDRLSGRSVVDVYEATFASGVRRQSSGHAPGILEHVFVISGRLVVGPTGRTVEAAAGDFVRFPADGPHVYEALEGDARAVLLISYTWPPSGSQEMHRELEHLLSEGDRCLSGDKEEPLL